MTEVQIDKISLYIHPSGQAVNFQPKHTNGIGGIIEINLASSLISVLGTIAYIEALPDPS